MQKTVAALVLAAGQSSRMGAQNKLTTLWQGKPLLIHTMEALSRSAIDTLIVVTGHEAETVRPLIPATAITVHNPAYATGMASSLRVGLERALEANCDGVLILLGDMPMISAEHINTMLKAFDGVSDDTIVQATADGRPGNPVLIGSTYFRDVSGLTGDRGAREILKAHFDKIIAIEIGAAARRDFDTPEAFAASPHRTG